MMNNPGDSYYTTGRINYWLTHWGDLVALAESPGTAYGLTDPRPTPATPKVGARQKGFSGDRLGWALVKADIERAAAMLEGMSYEWFTVNSYFHGHNVEWLIEFKGWDARVVGDAFSRALRQMAKLLNGRTEEERRCAWVECGKSLDGLRADADYCSDGCRLRAWRANQTLVAT